MAYEVAAGIPDKIAATVPVFGLPLIGGLKVPNQLADVAYMFLSGRQDRVVPIDGSVSNQGWYYINHKEASEMYANVHGCSATTRVVKTPVDGGQDNMECVEHICSGRAAGNGRVMNCLYDGGHSYPSGSRGQQLIKWFLDGAKAISGK